MFRVIRLTEYQTYMYKRTEDSDVNKPGHRAVDVREPLLYGEIHVGGKRHVRTPVLCPMTYRAAARGQHLSQRRPLL